MTRNDQLKRAVAKAAVIVACALLPAISSASQDTDAMKARNTAETSMQAAGSHVYVVNGDVFVAQGKNAAHRVDGNEAIVSNTLVSTGKNSSALLKFEDGQVVTMQPNSSFRIREYRYDAKKIENSNIVFSMLRGGMRFATGLIGKLRKQAFRLATPNATIGIRGTDFMVTMAGKSMYSQVLNGKIAMTNAAGLKIVGAGQSAVVASSSALASLVSASAIPAGTFSELMTIPVDPSAIPAPAPAPAPAPPPVPSAEVGAAASVAGATAGIAGGAIAGMAGGESESEQEAAPAPEESPEPAAVPEETQAEEGRSGVGITGKVGTLGLGAELNLAFSDSFGARIGYNAFTYKYNTNLSSVNYDLNLKLQSVSILGDWYPFSGSFRTSAGVVYNNNQANLTGIPGAGGFTINGVTYTSVSSVQSTMSFNKVAPYLGIGWGNPVASDKGWGMTSDIGVLFQGSPKTDLTIACTAGCPTASDVAAENAKMQNDLKNFKYWPVVSIGISYQW
jgi:FecR protein